MLRARWLIYLLLFKAGTNPLHAQNRSREFLELTFGGTTLVGSEPFRGEYYKYFSDILFLVTLGTQPDEKRALVTALEVGLLGMPLGDDSCRLIPLGGCARRYPFSGVIALTAGGRPITSRWRFVEVTVGPALIGQDGSGTPLGALAKVRIGSPPGTYLSPGIALYGIAKVVNGGPLFGIGGGLGFRAW